MSITTRHVPPAPPERLPVIAPQDRCSVCMHPTTLHDAIAARFCAATLAQVLTRECICR